MAIADNLRVKLFQAIDLPQPPAQRFKLIFAQRKQWSMEQIRLYVEGALPPNVTVEQFLVQWTLRGTDGLFAVKEVWEFSQINGNSDLFNLIN